MLMLFAFSFLSLEFFAGCEIHFLFLPLDFIAYKVSLLNVLIYLIWLMIFHSQCLFI